jgi:hypothetical protein
MDIKKLKTSQLLDKIEDVGDDDVLFGELLEEIDERTPFAYLVERIEELENRNTELGKEIQRLRNSMRGHTHLATGKSVIEI